MTTLAAHLIAAERTYIADLLSVTRGDVAAAARHAGCHRVSFWRLCQRHGLTPSHYRETPQVVESHPLMMMGAG